MVTKFPAVEIHPTAIIAEGAEIGAGSSIGAYSIIGPHVRLGEGTQVGPHVVIEGHTTLGRGNRVFQFSSVGAIPQDLKYHGEPSTLVLGDQNIIREFVTLQPGTEGGGMTTTIGHKNLFMANCHVGHDSRIGNSCIVANSVAIAGHVTIGNFVTLGGLSAVHQFVLIGDYAMLGGGSMVAQDIPPFVIAQGDRAKVVGINSIGLERRSFSPETISQIKGAYRALFVRKGTLAERLSAAATEFAASAEATVFIDFVKNSKRGVAQSRKSAE